MLFAINRPDAGHYPATFNSFRAPRKDHLFTTTIRIGATVFASISFACSFITPTKNFHLNFPENCRAETRTLVKRQQFMVCMEKIFDC
jgi:hypothetical protein